MQQSKKESFIEASMNVVIGYSISLIAQVLIFPLFGIIIPFSTNMLLGVFFTSMSLIRSYIIRRWFNAKLHRMAKAMAGTI